MAKAKNSKNSKKVKEVKQVKEDSKEVSKNNVKTDNSLSGIGGWLLFIVILLSLNLVIQIPSAIYTLISTFSSLFLVYTVLSLVLTVSLLVLILNKRKSSIPKITGIFWLSAILESVIGFIQIINMTPSLEVSKAIIYVSFVFGVAIEFAIAFLLVSYFKKSVRVKNTFVN